MVKRRHENRIARISTDDQNLDLQRDALDSAGCERLFTDTISGAKADRPGLASAIAFARAGNVLVVWRLDRLGRSLPHLVCLIGELDAAGIGFESLAEKIDATTAAWCFMSSRRWLSSSAT